MKKVDRRVRRTRNLLAAALHQLVLEKPYEGITIQDITDRADLNRATFYLHYASKEELLMDSLEAQFDELVGRMEAESNGTLPWENPTAARIIFEYAAENADLFRALMGESGQGYVMYRVVDYIARYDEHALRQVYDETELVIPVPILARQFAGSLFALIVWWLENEMPYPAQYMAETMQRLCLFGASPVMDGAAVKVSS